MDNAEVLKIMLALLIVITILISFIMSMIVIRVSLSCEEKSKKAIKNRRKQNDIWRSK